MVKTKFDEQGYVFPIPVLSADELTEVQQQFLHWEQHFGGAYPREMTLKTHLLFKWADQLVNHPKVLASVKEILGPDILCWTTNLFVKNAHSKTFVSWHQDAPYWGLNPHEVVTAWIALSDSDTGNGGLCVLPGSHKVELSPHRDTFGKNNMLTRGQEIAIEVDESKTVCLELKAGEMSLHHIRLAHGSGPNDSDRRRIGLAIRYLPTYVKQTKTRDFAQLVSGKDQHHNFEIEPRLTKDLDPVTRRFHKRSVIRQIQNNFLPMTGASFLNRAKLSVPRIILPMLLKIKSLFQ